MTDTATSTTLSTVLTGLDPETTYTITVEALDAAGHVSTTGPSTSGTTDEPAPVPDTTAPTWTGGGSASVSGETEDSMTVSWSGATDAEGVTSYVVTYRRWWRDRHYDQHNIEHGVNRLGSRDHLHDNGGGTGCGSNVSTTGPSTSGTTDEPAPVPDTTAPTWTGGGSASVSGETEDSMTVSWSGATDAEGVTSYVVTYVGGGVTDTTTSTTLSTVLTGLDPETTYTITVEALDAAGNVSTTGPSTSGTTDEPAPVPDTTAPTWTGGGSLTVSDETETSMVVTWSGATDDVGVTGYEVTYEVGAASTSVNSTTTTINLTGLDPETTYTITVEALDLAGNQSTTGPVTTGTTDAPAPAADLAAPTWSSGVVTVVSISEESALLNWSSASDDVGVTAYVVTYDDGVNQAGSEVSSVLGITLDSLTVNTEYRFSVEARDAAGNLSDTGPSVIDTTRDVTPPTWPASLVSLDAISDTTATVSWSGAADNVGVIGYTVEVRDSDGPAGFTLVTALSETVVGLTPNTAYTFTVRARDAASNISSDAGSPFVVGTTDAGGANPAGLNASAG